MDHFCHVENRWVGDIEGLRQVSEVVRAEVEDKGRGRGGGVGTEEVEDC